MLPQIPVVYNDGSGKAGNAAKQVEVVLNQKNVTADGFAAILSFADTGNVELTPENVQEILNAANVFGIRFLIDSCEKFKSLSHEFHMGAKRYSSGNEVKQFDRPPIFREPDAGVMIKRIEVWERTWHGHRVLGGIRISYTGTDAQYTQGVTSLKCGWEYHVAELQKNEYITSVSVGSGYLIDRFVFRTNKTRVLGPLGGPGGGEYEADARGGTVSYLHDIACDATPTDGDEALLNLQFRWVTFD